MEGGGAEGGVAAAHTISSMLVHFENGSKAITTTATIQLQDERAGIQKGIDADGKIRRKGAASDPRWRDVDLRHSELQGTEACGMLNFECPT